MQRNKIYLNKERDVFLTPYTVSEKKAPTILIVPGGGYTECEASEGEPVAKVYNSYGLNAFVLCYSVGKHYQWPYPLDDYEQAMQYIIDNAEKFHVDTEYILAAGFSAGGHLISIAASTAKHKPYAAIICYGATIKHWMEITAPNAPDANEAVNMNTCPCFIVSSRNDWIVPINNTTEFIKALNENYIDYETHIYGYAMHGFSIGKDVGAVGSLFCSRVGNWVKESIEWIEELISGRYISIRECAEYNDQFAQTLSSMNSCKIIFENEEAHKLVKRRFLPLYLIYVASKKQIGAFVDGISLKNVLQFVKIKDEKITKIDKALSIFAINRK